MALGIAGLAARPRGRGDGRRAARGGLRRRACCSSRSRRCSPTTTARGAAVALTEANVFASAAYVVLVGTVALPSSRWRAALFDELPVPLASASHRALPITTAPPAAEQHGRLSGAFYVAAVMMFCTVAAEWCVTAWGASFAKEAADVSADTAVALMFGYFGGVLVGRASGGRARAPVRRFPPVGGGVGGRRGRVRGAVAVRELGAGLRGPVRHRDRARQPVPVRIGGDVALAPERAQLASSRAVLAGSTAVLAAPLTIGALADATSITSALLVVPVMLGLAAVGLAAIRAS